MKKETDLSRRKFLKGSVIGAGALTAGFAGGLGVPGTAHASLPVLPLPYCKDSGGTPTNTPNASNQTVLDPDDVRVMTWWYYSSQGKG
ncbi:MAG: twin-arginine translocation signal domain-containing protein [Thermodesulfobacteriota bacterium]|nr:twin-arginine translocation signal domain-containing protein [Thermodesulfobacteriota bacterium]